MSFTEEDNILINNFFRFKGLKW